MCKKCDALQAAIDKHISAVRAADKTEDYSYSRTKGELSVNRFGAMPPSGNRWLTPRELADVLWLDCAKIMKTEEVSA